MIFSSKVVPYSQTSNPLYNTVRNEIRRIDNFGEKEIRRREKNINWIVEYTHPGITIKATGIKRDSSTNFFIFLPPLNLPGKASRICKCWFDDVVSRRRASNAALALTELLGRKLEGCFHSSAGISRVHGSTAFLILYIMQTLLKTIQVLAIGWYLLMTYYSVVILCADMLWIIWYFGRNSSVC